MSDRSATMGADDDQVAVLFGRRARDFVGRASMQEEHPRLSKPGVRQSPLALSPGVLLLDLGEIRGKIPFRNGRKARQKIGLLQDVAQNDLGAESLGQRRSVAE